MNLMKKRILAAFCAAMMMLSMAACGGKDSGSTGSGAGSSADAATSEPAAPSAMSKDDYLAAVEGLNTAAEEFTVASAELIANGLTNAEDLDALSASVEKIRETRQPFTDFSGINNPAEGYEEAHTALAKSCGDFSDLINEYCDVLLKTMKGEDAGDSADLQARMETVINDLGEAVGAVQAIQ